MAGLFSPNSALCRSTQCPSDLSPGRGVGYEGLLRLTLRITTLSGLGLALPKSDFGETGQGQPVALASPRLQRSAGSQAATASSQDGLTSVDIAKAGEYPTRRNCRIWPIDRCTAVLRGLTILARLCG